MRAVFFDRDGVINQDFGYVYRPRDFIFLEGLFELLAFCKDRGYLLILVTNQSGIGMGYYSQRDFEILSAYMQDQLQSALGFGMDGIYHCPHAPKENCPCRKPKPGMILQAIKEHGIHPGQSILIGDRARDIQAAQNAGVKYKILLDTPGKDNREEIPEMSNFYKITHLKEMIEILKKEIK
ncbi:D-glycero-alpha-D-manno-heptose-1,7-bisphosphate 7-phosphatase [Helicobacter mustelae]|uniref:D,D-heptose 1,7-bisphosphate phosphatase n=1 Tax=Helicobacter mustelae (strain ATCC 43772 / CCUG 25715 / CIP 103759 / LMG 18044 / NCTC 12198 / R85-136P) TaxID=679897 RepID=D3UI30_HELM1|nr:HAD family hydrolase [Helicobacter mustelae]CBG40153.1 D,D-heptose 1,7-bisphosphate phosphatase [Helicobacter mustelae 12198]SQH71655.1 D,D-heptose 1,7-bisphosphate phosphatase [Helicobacter mustelae]STP12780.1 D,D-heptose 1,7-bisphosphate phosphatase [Helicobacter mustelae]